MCRKHILLLRIFLVTCEVYFSLMILLVRSILILHLINLSLFSYLDVNWSTVSLIKLNTLFGVGSYLLAKLKACFYVGNIWSLVHLHTFLFYILI